MHVLLLDTGSDAEEPSTLKCFAPGAYAAASLNVVKATSLESLQLMIRRRNIEAIFIDADTAHNYAWNAVETEGLAAIKAGSMGTSAGSGGIGDIGGAKGKAVGAEENGGVEAR
jgi:hypothetical protein